MRRRQPPCIRAAIWEVGKYSQNKIAYRAAERFSFCRPITEKDKRKRTILQYPFPFAFLQKNRRMSR